MTIREDSILFLLGAGASVDAGIPHAGKMTEDIEDKVNNNSEFRPYRELYNYLKSSIIYQRGLAGDFDSRLVNIEDLLNILYELKKKDGNQLYPFIGSWNTHLMKVAGDNFENVDELDKNIRKQLLKWVKIPHYKKKADYFSGLGRFAREVGGTIRVFTLNYDLCVEKVLAGDNVTLELGFDPLTREWEATRFDRNDELPIQVYLYKLHGSIDWVRSNKEKGNLLCQYDDPADEPELIFGTPAKLETIDPYLFYVHEFRRYSLEKSLRLIITVGYSFSDEYINTLISQALTRNDLCRVIVIAPEALEDHEKITKKLTVDTSLIIPLKSTAKDFFVNQLSDEFCQEYFLKNEDAPF